MLNFQYSTFNDRLLRKFQYNKHEESVSIVDHWYYLYGVPGYYAKIEFS